jgi:hypothetical protein
MPDISLTISLPEGAVAYIDRLRLSGHPAASDRAEACRYLIVRGLDDMVREGVFRAPLTTRYQGRDDD